MQYFLCRVLRFRRKRKQEFGFSGIIYATTHDADERFPSEVKRQSEVLREHLAGASYSLD